ncbi:hypothetical protein HPB50_024941 [Hyalomma asiaticum]|uniref:Uncharacterized protein n=1 Tax=Hyalomma asiaticum TaxID=266040 RepID=A0ACB7TU85_HYAAI|nr:hypothetical protein HPB50_024941 [Hyalomma asiaticum]
MGHKGLGEGRRQPVKTDDRRRTMGARAGAPPPRSSIPLDYTFSRAGAVSPSSLPRHTVSRPAIPEIKGTSNESACP